MTTLLVTGSSGLIGKTLRESLNKNLFRIKEFDINFPSFHAHYGDIKNLDIVKKAVQDCDGIIHLAGVSRVIWGERDPELCWQTNVLGTANVLRAAYESDKQPWVLFSSSREVYGQQAQLPVKESAILQPVNVYARSKVAAEELVNQYQTLGLKTAILRFSNVYGRLEDHADRVIPAFCRAAAWGEPLRIEGSENTFDFTYVHDVVKGIQKAIDLLQQQNVLPTMHLTTGYPTTLRQAAEYACLASQIQSKLIEAPARNFDVATFCGDPSLAYEVLGWHAQVKIEEGIKKMVYKFSQIKKQLAV